MSVERHYNKHRARKDDFMLPVRKFHNFVKARLIASVCQEDTSRYLDFCCGNGGDIGKLVFHNIKEYIGIDIANQAVERAAMRLKEAQLTGDAISLNAFSLTCGNMLERMRPFNIVSCQFALHYAFSTESMARTAIQNISMAMMRGSYFIGTIPDCEYLLNSRKQLGKKFGDRYHKVNFENKEFNEKFGDAYEFSFTGAVDTLTEYVVHKSILVDLCDECGLELVAWRNFKEYYDDRDQAIDLWNRMGASFVPVSQMYITFCFRKYDDE